MIIVAETPEKEQLNPLKKVQNRKERRIKTPKMFPNTSPLLPSHPTKVSMTDIKPSFAEKKSPEDVIKQTNNNNNRVILDYSDDDDEEELKAVTSATTVKRKLYKKKDGVLDNDIAVISSSFIPKTSSDDITVISSNCAPKKNIISHFLLSSDEEISAVVPEKKRGRFVKKSSVTSSSATSIPSQPAINIIKDDETEDLETEEEDWDLEIDPTDFFNTCTADELRQITSCNLEMFNLIAGCRPFVNEEDLRSRLPTVKKLGRKLIAILDKYIDMMTAFSYVDKMIAKCDSYGQSLINEMESMGLMQNKSLEQEEGNNLFDFKSSSMAFKQPQLISRQYTLKGYQLVGCAYLSCLYKSKLGGILADEMGLGKTAQVIAFIAHLAEQGDQGPHLIVVPSSVMDNWVREFQNFCPSLNVILYHGSANERTSQREEIMYQRKQNKLLPHSQQKTIFNVMITTYNIASSTSSANERERGWLKKKLGFKSMILDEGHMIKNGSSNRFKSLVDFGIPVKILLTGTPLQNNLGELLTLLTFSIPNLFGTDKNSVYLEDQVTKLFNSKTASKQVSLSASSSSLQTLQDQEVEGSRNNDVFYAGRIEKAKKMIAPFILRRSKAMVLKDLPQKTCSVEYCSPTSKQSEIYNRILLLKQAERKDKPTTSSVADDDDLLLSFAFEDNAELSKRATANYLMEMRKIANHPLLARTIFDEDKLKVMAKDIRKEPEYYDANYEYILEDMRLMNDHELNVLCEKFPYSLKKHKLDDQLYFDSGKILRLKELLPEMLENGDKLLIFSQFTMQLDILTRVLDSMKINHVRMDGQTNVRDRQELIDLFNSSTDINVFLLSTKACGLGLNLTSANVVILHDLDFNPHNDKQAEDRCHRVGQKREVKVVRMVVKDTIEERVYELAHHKLELDNMMKK